MSLNKVLAFALLVSVVFFSAACERTITHNDVVQAPANCFSCHSDQNTFLVAAERQYEYSVHASGNNIDRNTNPCNTCHTSDGFVDKVTGQAIPATIANPTAIHCFTCHAPHTNGNLTLRTEAPVALANGVTVNLGAGNLCANCHQDRSDVNAVVRTANDTVNVSNTHWGPHHSVQADMLWGTNGYEYNGYTYLQTNHKGATKDGCVDCHFRTTHNYVVGGHSFNMAYEEGGSEELNTAACSQVGCHGARNNFDLGNVQTDVDTLVKQLGALLVTYNLLDTGGHPIVRKVASSDSAGALWNYLKVEEDRSEGVHNRGYIESLLRSSIEFLGGTPYPPLTGPSPASLARREKN